MQPTVFSFVVLTTLLVVTVCFASETIPGENVMNVNIEFNLFFMFTDCFNPGNTELF